METFELRFGVSRVIGGRKNQEDEYTCYDALSKGKGPAIFAVFDGHGTDDYSAFASNTLHKQILESEMFKNGQYKEAIRAGFATEDKMLYEKIHADRGGSTSTVAVIVGNELFVGHLGDSRAVLAIKDNRLSQNDQFYFPVTPGQELPVRAVRISRDHKPDDPEERSRILQAGGIVVQGRVVGKETTINMSRALGDFDFKLPKNDARADFISSAPYIPDPIKLTPQCTFIVLGSDGLWDQMEERTVINTIDEMWLKGTNPTAIADSITEKLAGPSGIDNVTVIIVFFIWDPTTLPNHKHGSHTNEELISSHESRVAP